jgi:ribonucleotide monophosphatase NagD (HAD superfamily)
MKNIGKVKSLLYFILMMVFTIEIIKEHADCSINSNSGKRRTKRGRAGLGKKRKSQKHGKRRGGKAKNVVNIQNMTSETVELALAKTTVNVQPDKIYSEGMAILEHIEGNTKSEKAVAVGNYFIEPKGNVSTEDIESIVAKLPYLLPLVLFNAMSKDFNLNAAVITFQHDDEYKKVYSINQNEITNAIQKSDFFKKTENEKELIKYILLLAIKTILVGSNEKPGLLKKMTSKLFSKNFIETFHSIVQENKLINEISLIQNLKLESKYAHLNIVEAYIISSIACYLEKDFLKQPFLKSLFFETIVHGVTIPVNAQLKEADDVELINIEAHKTIRKCYSMLLKLYDISSIDITETNSGLLAIESTFLYSAKKVAQVIALGAGAAGLGMAIRGAQHVYQGDEKDSYWERAKKGLGKDYDDSSEYISEKYEAGKKYGSENIGTPLKNKWNSWFGGEEKKEVTDEKTTDKKTDIIINKANKSDITNKTLGSTTSPNLSKEDLEKEFEAFYEKKQAKEYKIEDITKNPIKRGKQAAKNVGEFLGLVSPQ